MARARCRAGLRVPGAHLLLLGVIAAAVPCPQPTEDLYSTRKSKRKVNVQFVSDIVGVELEVAWVVHDGTERVLNPVDPLVPGDSSYQHTWPGHIFRFYAAGSEEGERLLVKEYIVPEEPEPVVKVESCDELAKLQRGVKLRGKGLSKAKRRHPEFEALVHAGSRDSAGPPLAPCEPAGQSSTWSCVRRVPAEQCEARHANVPDAAEGNKFGFQAEQGKWPVGAYEDHQFDWQQPKIPRLSEGCGFLKMNMTEKLKSALLPWYAERVAKNKTKKEPHVPGGYLNDESITSHIVKMDRAHLVKQIVMTEMKQVLEWWTGKSLQHHATFGARVYQRGAVLLNHVDRFQSHLASVIMQVHQEVDEDGGWPVEVLSDDRDCFEVYLQPGEMLLYEGAHFKHGRPMVFRGEAFANVFSHFAPRDWQGVDKNEL